MRLIVILLTFMLFVGIVGFVLTNLDTQVEVKVWNTVYPDLPLFVIVIVAVLVGIFYAGLIGVAEGAHIRLANRRLDREVRRLEAELNYQRTQLLPAGREEPDAVPEVLRPAEARETPEPQKTVASAPVYGTDDGSTDPDDEPYSGGRAV